jgi:hypothetical protein
MDLNPDNWVSLRIKIDPPAKGLYTDCVFFEALCSPRNSFVGYELKQLLQRQGISKCAGMNNPVDLLSTLLGRRCVILRCC